MSKRTRAREVVCLSERQVEEMISKCSLTSWTGRRNAALVAVAYGSALRVGELLWLRPEHLEDAGAVLLTPGQVDNEPDAAGRWPYRAVPKTAPRRVPLDAKTRVALARWLTERGSGRRTAVLRSPWLFPTYDGGQLQPAYVLQLLKRLAADAGIPVKQRLSDPSGVRIYAHLLRASRLSHLEAAGWTLRELQEYAGHAHPSTTDSYLHTVSGSKGLKAAMVRLDSQQAAKSNKVETLMLALFGGEPTPAVEPSPEDLLVERLAGKVLARVLQELANN